MYPMETVPKWWRGFVAEAVRLRVGDVQCLAPTEFRKQAGPWWRDDMTPRSLCQAVKDLAKTLEEGYGYSKLTESHLLWELQEAVERLPVHGNYRDLANLVDVNLVLQSLVPLADRVFEDLRHRRWDSWHEDLENVYGELQTFLIYWEELRRLRTEDGQVVKYVVVPLHGTQEEVSGMENSLRRYVASLAAQATADFDC